jgi:hypothetical protein
MAHVPVSDDDFLNGLTPAGLRAAAEYLEQDLEKLQENGLPTGDTMSGIVIVNNLLFVNGVLSE